MESIYSWVKNLVFFYILMTAVLHLLPKSSYEKYVRFFCGLLLVVLLLSPVLELIYDSGYLLEKINYENFWQETDSMKLDVKGMEQAQKETFLAEYEKAIENDISGMAEDEGLLVNDVRVELSADYKLEHISLSVSLAEQQEGIRIQKITLKDNSREYPHVLEVKEKIMKFYEVDSSQIQIAVQED